MGDRGNIVCQSNGADIYLYTHWSGSDLPGIVARGLKRGESRWGDEPYLNRVLFCQMLIEGGKDEINDVTGYGIDTTMGDGGTEVYVSHVSESVTYNDEVYTFPDFVKKFA